MRAYELMLVFDPAVDPSDTKKINSLVEKFLGENAKFIKNTEIIGKKKLRYSINKNMEGVYALVTLEASSIDTVHMVKQDKLMTEIVRFLFTVKKK
ncbi:30S ribosomal protein S6 [Patescibacteria group bacterium]